MRKISTALIIGILVASLYVMSISPPASAICTGAHYDLTTEAVTREGFVAGSDAVDWLQVSSFYADAYDVASTDLTPWYSYVLGWGETIDRMFPNDLRLMSGKCLHFNGLGQGGGVKEAINQWNDLVEATKRTVQGLSSSNAGDEMILLTALGVSLHKVQDFYAHSNWASLGFNDATWFDVTFEDKNESGLDGYGPWYNATEGLQEADVPGYFKSSHGNYWLPPHPLYPRVYREAFYASWQWVKLVKSWVNLALWQKAASLSDPDVSWEENFWRGMNAYASKWKGNTAGVDQAAILFTLDDYVNYHQLGYDPGACMVTWWDVAPDVCARGLNVAAPDTLPRVPQQGWLTIYTEKVGEHHDAHYMGIDVGGTPDFEAWITVNGRRYFEPEYINQDDFWPSAWTQQIPLDPNEYGDLSIRYELYDNDAPLYASEHCAIGGKEWDWTYTGLLADLISSPVVYTEGEGGYNEDQAYVLLYFSFYSDQPPVANAGSLYIGDEGSWITFNGSMSYDAGGDTLRYRWDFEDNGVWDTPWSTNPVAAHRYGHEFFLQQIALQVSDGLHLSSAKALVSVFNVPPVPHILADPSCNEGDVYHFSGPIYDEGWLDTWSVQWDFGDGTGATEGLIQNHIYKEDGSYTVNYTVTDDGGMTGTDTFTAKVYNVPPKVEVGPDRQATEGQDIIFNGTFVDPGSLDTHTVHWDFGDGTTDDVHLIPKHAYGDNGTYVVSLTVVDDDGGVGSDTLTMTVGNAPPVANINAVDQSNPVFVLAGFDTLTFRGALTDPGWLDTHTALWSFGDGTSDAGTIVEENEAPNATARLTCSHLYAQPGQYTVTLTVTDDDGASATAQYVVTVVSPVEAIDLLDKWIQGLPDSAFKWPASTTRMALSNKLATLKTMFKRDPANGATEKALKDLRAKMDGSLGGNRKDDWIIDPKAQSSLCAALDDLIAYVRHLRSSI